MAYQQKPTELQSYNLKFSERRQYLHDNRDFIVLGRKDVIGLISETKSQPYVVISEENEKSGSSADLYSTVYPVCFSPGLNISKWLYRNLKK